jgi:hypothetical protein
LQGETGTGKGLLARTIHERSPRARGPFVDLNCAAIPTTLLESELFGFERGAFTDARQARTGLIEAADGGTLFLDEIGLLPEELQAKLLTVIESREIRPLGGTRTRQVDVLIVAATNADLRAAVHERRFREDLYHRLAVLVFSLPPLRQRSDDVLELAEAFLARACADYRMPLRPLSEDARAALLRHAWPGNVRELANVIDRAVLLTAGPSSMDRRVPYRRWALPPPRQVAQPRGRPRSAPCLTRLQAAELLYTTRLDPAPEYTFTHALTHEVAYQSLADDVRRQSHERLVRALEARLPAIARAQPELLAYHCTAAGLLEPAAAYWLRATRRAAARSAHTEALAYGTRGLEAVARLPESMGRDRQELDLRLLLVTPDRAWKDQEPGLRRARELGERLQDPGRLLHVISREWMHFMALPDLPRALALAQQYGAAASARDQDLRLYRHGLLASPLFYMGRFEEALAQADAGVPAYDRTQHYPGVSGTNVDIAAMCLGWSANSLWRSAIPTRHGGASTRCWSMLARSSIRTRSPGPAWSRPVGCGCGETTRRPGKSSSTPASGSPPSTASPSC